MLNDVIYYSTYNEILHVTRLKFKFKFKFWLADFNCACNIKYPERGYS